MKKRNFFNLAVVFFLIIALTAPAFANFARPGHAALAVVLSDKTTGDIIFAENEHTPLHPASTTKVMTALLAVEALDRGDISIADLLTVTPAALADMVPAGSNIGLEVGEQMSFEALLFSIMLESANDASNVLAEYLGGTISGFIEMMNERAVQLGARNTNFMNPHGLTQDGHVSTAYDIFRISQYAIQNPRFVELYSWQERPHAATNMRAAGFFTSTNQLTNPESPYYFSGASGVKTGFTSASGHSLISTATRSDISLMAVVMGVAPNQEGVTHFTESALLYNWVFENFTHQELFPAGHEITSVPIALGSDTATIGLLLDRSASALVHIGTDPSTDMQQEITLFSEEAGEPLTAPIQQGDILGELLLHAEGRTFAPIPLIASESVSISRLSYFQSEFENTFSSLWVRLVIVALLILVTLYIVYTIRFNMRKRRQRRARLRRR